MKKKRIICFVLLVCVLAAAFHLLQPRSLGIAYRVSGGQNEMIILGSIHVGSKAMYPMNRELQNAIRNADILVFECDTDSEEARRLTQEMMFYPDLDALSNHISPETRRQLSLASQKVGLNDGLFESMKPWAVTSMLSLEDTSTQMGGATTELGVESVVKKLAKGKPKLYLETVEEQLGMMDAFSPALQDYLLQTACETIIEEKGEEDLSSWPLWWVDGNADAFAKSYLKSQENEKEPALAQEYHNSLITLRNQKMAKKLADLLETGNDKQYFVTIGLMHLVLPDDSVLRELENMGYQVEAI